MSFTETSSRFTNPSKQMAIELRGMGGVGREERGGIRGKRRGRDKGSWGGMRVGGNVGTETLQNENGFPKVTYSPPGSSSDLATAW